MTLKLDTKSIIKKYNIPYSYLEKHMGYTRTHISRVLNGRSPMHDKFKNLLFIAIEKYIEKDYHDLKELKEMIWNQFS